MIEPHEFIRKYFNISDKHTIHYHLGGSISINILIELMRAYKDNLSNSDGHLPKLPSFYDVIKQTCMIDLANKDVADVYDIIKKLGNFS